jgi:serine/threonine protein kinase
VQELSDLQIGRYQVKEPLGHGGMAVVYLARDPLLERVVAMKFIRMEAVSQVFASKMIRRFEQESRLLAKLSHPNIVSVIDSGKFEDIPYLVMEYIPGGTIQPEMGSHMPYRQAARLLLPIAEALQYAHEEGIIHRDVKPSNILLTKSGQPMLSDFGIAKIIAGEHAVALTATSAGIGTPEYMSPEQGLGHAVDPRADLYSLGVVFYELVTGRKPFEGKTPMEVIIKHIHEPLPSPSSFVKDLPEEVAAVLRKALAKNPDDRYPDMKAFAVALEKLAFQDANNALNEITSADFGQSPAPLKAMLSRMASAPAVETGVTYDPHAPLVNRRELFPWIQRIRFALQRQPSGKLWPLFTGGFFLLLVLVIVIWATVSVMTLRGSQGKGPLSVLATESPAAYPTVSVSSVLATGEPTCRARELEWTSPQEGDELNGEIPMRGTVAVEQMVNYVYEFNPSQSEDWILIGAGNQAKQDQILGDPWDTGNLAAGSYRLRITALDGQNQILAVCVIEVWVSTP